MSKSLIVIVGLIYAAISIEQFTKHNPGMGVIFLGYAVANGGMWWIAE